MQIIHVTVISMKMIISANTDTPNTIYIIILLDEDILLGANGRNIVIMMIHNINNNLKRNYSMFLEHINHLFGFKVFVL